MDVPYREIVHACAFRETYKYFFPRERVAEVWGRLEGAYGAIRRNEAFKTMEIECATFLFRSTWLANPITVIRKRGCSEDDVHSLHAIVGFGV